MMMSMWLKKWKNTPRFLLIMVLVILCLKLLIHFLVLPTVYDHFSNFRQVNSFPDGYGDIAENLVNGKGYRYFPDTAETMMRPPGYVLLLAGIFYVFGQTITAVTLINIFFSLLTFVLLCRFSRFISTDGNINYTAPIIFSFYPGIILAESRAGIEVFYCLLLTVFMFFFYRSIKDRTFYSYMIAGFVFGFALLVKNSHLLFLIAALPYLLIKLKDREDYQLAFARYAVMVIAAVLIYSPWVYRNYLVTGKFVPFMTVKGVSAFQGFYLNKHFPSEKGQRKLIWEASDIQNEIARQNDFEFKPGFTQYFYDSKDEMLFDSLLFNHIKNKYIENPLLVVKNSLINFLRFWYSGDKSFVYLSFILAVFNLALITLGIYFDRACRMSLLPITVFIACFIIPHLPMLSMARYHVPLIPLICLYVIPIQHHIYHRRTNPSQAIRVYRTQNG